MEYPVLDLRRYANPGGEQNAAVLLGRMQRCERPEALLAQNQLQRPHPADVDHLRWPPRLARVVPHHLRPLLATVQRLLRRVHI